MSKHLALICQPELLGPSYLVDKRHVALNIAVAITDGAAEKDDRKLMKPWDWKGVSHVVLSVELNNGAVLSKTIEVVKNPELPDAQKKSLIKGADAVVTRHDKLEWLNWDRKPKEQVDGERHLPSMLMDMSRWPAPLPQVLNLAHYVAVDETYLEGAVRLHAAPVFKDRDGFEHTPKDPETNPGALRPDTEQPAMYVWDYGDADVVGYGRPFDLTEIYKNEESFIDFNRLWIRARLKGDKEGNWHHADWLAEIPEKIAEALDASSRLYEFGRRLAGANDPGDSLWSLREALEKRDTAPVWGRTWLRRAGLRALRRYAHAGTRKGPDGLLFLDVLVQDYRTVIGADIDDEIHTAVKAFEKKIDTELYQTLPAATDAEIFPIWRALLREAVGSSLAESDLLTRSPSRVPADALPPLADDLKSLNGLIAQIRDSRVLSRLVLLIWRKAVEEKLMTHPDLGLAWRQVESNLEEHVLPRYNLRRRLGLSSAGDRVDAVFRNVGDVAGQERAVLRTRFVEEHEKSVSADLMRAEWIDQLPNGGDDSLRAQMHKLFKEVVGSYATGVAKRQLFPPLPAEESGDDLPTERSHRIGFQIDRLAADTDADNPDFADSDYLRRLAGVAVFLREAKRHCTQNPNDGDFEDWRSLNMAKLSILVSPDGKNNLDYEQVSDASLVAYGLPYRDGLRKAFIYYDNAPLIALDQQMTDDGLQISHAAQGAAMTAFSNGDDGIPLLKYERTETSAWARKLPRLRFGQVYEASCAAVSNSGALPSGWARNGAAHHPALLALNPGKDPDKDFIHRVRYLRRVRIGQLRVEGPRKALGEERVRPAAADSSVRPLFDSLDTFARPAGLQDGESVTYYRHAETERAQLALAGTGWHLVITGIETKFLGERVGFEVALKDGSATPVSAGLRTIGASYSVEIVVGGTTVTREIPKIQADRIDLVLEGTSDATGEKPEDPVTTALRVGLQATGTHPRHVDPKTVAGVTPPILKAYVQVTATGGRVNFDRPAMRVGPEFVPPENAGDVPRILLTPTEWGGRAGSYRFKVRTPTTDIATWDRWRAMDEWLDPKEAKEIRAERANILSDQYHELRKPDAKPERVLLDDPALVQRMMVELIPVYSQSGGVPVRKFIDIERPPKDPENPFLYWQSLPITVNCTVQVKPVDPLIVLPSADKPEVSIRVPEGEVWEARLSSLVEQKFFYDGTNDPKIDPGRFPARVRQGLPIVEDPENEDPENKVSYVAVAPYRWVLEGATDEIPSAEDLWAALVCRHEGSRVRVWLDPERALGNWRMFAYLGEVELKRQLWRWEGRPNAFTVPFNAGRKIDVKFPYDRTPEQIDEWEKDGETTALLWDVIGFSDREDDDFVRGNRFAELAPVTTVLFERDITGDTRAQYYRFAVVAKSRYRGLIGDNAVGKRVQARDGIQGRHPKADQNVDLDTPRDSLRAPWPWRRLFVPCRRIETEILPKPKLKFVVPLTTRPDEVGGQLPGLLVVLDEPWFDIGGLPELLTCDVARVAERGRVASNDDSDPFAYSYPGLPLSGPDPMLHGGHWLDYDETEPSRGDEVKEKFHLEFNVSGPIGYTFDRETPAPRFVGTSFFLEPTLRDGEGNSVQDISELPWAFASLQFRRMIHAEGHSQALTLESDATAPFWHQLLPDASRYFVELAGEKAETVEQPANKIIATVDATTGKLRFLIKRGGVEIEVTPLPAPKGGKVEHRLFMLLTRSIYSMWGEKRDESYVGIAPLGADLDLASMIGPKTGFKRGKPIASDSDILLRLIEVQFHEQDADNETLSEALKGTAPEKLWDALFPEIEDRRPPQEKIGSARRLGVDSIARILRVSEPLQWRSSSKDAS